MRPLEAAQRAQIVAQARRWVGTPYHHRARLRGAGVDCAQILIAVFHDVGLIDDFDPGYYASDWHLHRSEERYAQTVLTFAAEYSFGSREPLPGDVLLFKHGRTYSHAAIVTDWPNVVHAYAASEIVEEVDTRHSPLLRLKGDLRQIRAFSYWGSK